MSDSGSAGTRAVLSAGTVLSGIYEIEAPLASGGMAEVYKGRNIHNDQPVAIKVVLREFANDELHLALFRKEGAVLSQLSHPAIVRYHLFAVDRDTNLPYLVTEIVEGMPLSERAEAGPLAVSELSILLRRLADGLSTAHALGIVHRDLSPDNVLLPGGDVHEAKIIDFGIARGGPTGRDTTILGNSFAGKYNFVSPEQVGMHGGVVGPASDIYGLALVALAASGTPFDLTGTGSPADLVERRAHSAFDLSAIDSRLRPLLTAMLASDPADRPSSMADVVRRLDAASAVAPHTVLRPARMTTGAGRIGTEIGESRPTPATSSASTILRAQPARRRSFSGIAAFAIVLAVAIGLVGYGAISGWFAPAPTKVDDPPQPSLPTLADARAALTSLGDGVPCFAFVVTQSATGTFDAVIYAAEPMNPSLPPQLAARVTVSTRVVRPPQCAALEFAKATMDAPTPPVIVLTTASIIDGATLSGTASGRDAVLFLVDDEGSVARVALDASGAFDVPIHLNGSGEGLPQLLLAVTGLGASAGQETAPSETFFGDLLVHREGLATALSSFVVAKSH